MSASSPFSDASAIGGLDSRLAILPGPVERLTELAASVTGRKAFSTSLGIEDQVLLDAVVQAGVEVDIFMLDTGRHFPETLDVLEASERHYGVRIHIVVPDAADTEALVRRDGISGFRSSIDARKACCAVRKVEPLRRALSGANLWLTGLRRGQSAGRDLTPFAAFDSDVGVLKCNPLADWSLDQVEAYIRKNGVPVNALHAQGFPSVGCQPCTRAVRSGEHIRAGRWWWEHEDGKECGLHNRPDTTAVQA